MMNLHSPSKGSLPSFRLLLCFLTTIITLFSLNGANAMHADEAGLNDFLLRTAGHGSVGVTYAKLVATSHDPEERVDVDESEHKVWITSQSGGYPSAVVDSGSLEGLGGGVDSGDGEDYCSIAARNITTGNVIWRVDACSSGVSSSNKNSNNSNDQFIPRHATLASVYLTIFSLDHTGILRGYNSPNGMLVLDTDVLANIDANNDNVWEFPGDVPRLLDATLAIGTVVTKGGGDTSNGSGNEDESLVLLDTGMMGQPIKEEGYHHQQSTSLLSARTLLQKARVSPKKYGSARIVDMHLLDESASRIGIWVAYSSTDNDGRIVSSFSSMAFVEVGLTPKPTSEGRIVMVYQIVRAVPLNVAQDGVASTPVLLSSLRMVQQENNEMVSLLAIAGGKSQLLVATVDMSTIKAKFGQSVEIDTLHPYWRSIASIHVENTRAVIDTQTSASDGSSYHVVRVAGIDDRYPTLPRRMESLFLLNENGFQRAYGSDEEIHQDALAYCADAGMVVATSEDPDDGETTASSFRFGGEDLLQTSRRVTWSDQEIEGDAVIVPSSSRSGKVRGHVKYAHMLECSDAGMTVAFTTLGGMTSAHRFKLSDSKSDAVAIEQIWSAEEALSSITSAIFLDETHTMTETTTADGTSADDEEETALQNLQFTNRIRSQLSSFQNFVFGGGAISSLASLALLSDEKKTERDIAFGFAKISVMLSQNLHRIVALDTARKGKVVWSANLHPRAAWHKLVHGGQFTSLNDIHGNGGVHDHEMLSLSYVQSSVDFGKSTDASFVEWKCFDGITGKTFSSESVSVSSSVLQIVPLRTSTHHPHDAKSCRQVALLVHSDHTISVVPDTARSYVIVGEAISSAGPNGLFVHTLDKETGEFLALRVSKKSNAERDSNPFELLAVGTTIFDPAQERVVNVAYPQRGEAIQSPSTVLGDDALLLKYLNPHLVVVVTEATPSFLDGVSAEGSDDDSEDGFYNALVGGGEYSGSSSSTGGQKRKPLGASKPGASEVPSSTNNNSATPSLFVSLVDSVSGQILHRVSHAHALASDMMTSSTQVPVVISENWVVYTFFNQRTRRTDVGVLTLHEGMIDKNGITAFNAPEQEESFSSLESAKPIVLSKTYGMTRTVTALGVTTTKAGISSKQFLFATGNDQVVSMDRRMLDPRRPNGELKESEKMEGLARYTPLLPIMPLRTPSHAYEVSSVSSMSSASANVESQSLVLAYGGPDVFFTRLAPSKGFDLLPDDFNRGLLSVVLVGLIVLLNVIQRMNKKKMVKTVWA